MQSISNNAKNAQYAGCIQGAGNEFIAKLEGFITTNNITCLIFDCDGTLMDTLPYHYLAWRDACVEHGHDFVSEELFMNRFSGISGHEMIGIISQESGKSIDASSVARTKNAIFMNEYIANIRPIQKVLDIINRYATNTDIRITLASGGHRGAVDIMLENNRLSQVFSSIVTIEDVTYGKPSPEIFMKAATLEGVNPSQCLVFEDAEAGFQAASNAGMHFVNIHMIND